MKITCDVISDLMPLVKDGVATRDSQLLVEEHVEHCQSCRLEYEMEADYVQQTQAVKDVKILAAIKRSVFMGEILLLVVGTIAGVVMTNSVGMFYNIFLMPIIGALSVWMFKGKWYQVPLIVFVLTYVWQLIQAFFDEGFYAQLFLGALYMAGIYLLLMYLGAAIARLLRYAFYGGGEQ